MEDIAPALYDKIKADFDSRVSGDAEIQRILKRIEEGTATARDTQYYAIRIGKHAADAFKENISSEVLPDGKMYYNIAERTVVPQLMENYEMVEGVAEAVQQQLNAEAGIGLNPVHVDVNQSRIDGIVNKITAADVYDTVAWMLVEPVRNFIQSVADDFVRENVAFQSKAGLSPKITREVYGNCCAWCAALAGTYEYKKEPKDFYRKHEYCRCLIIYDPGNGKVQNSHTKEWFQSERDARVQHAEQLESQEERQRFIDSIERNPKQLGDYTPESLKEALEQKGFTVKPLGRGNLKNVSFEEGGGYRVNYGGNGLLQYHPENGSHHQGAYYKISTGDHGTNHYTTKGDEIDVISSREAGRQIIK